MKKDRTELILHEKNIYKAFMILAYPVVFANIFKSLHDFVDTYFIGNLENSVVAQAGVAISWPLLNIFLSLSMGLSVAGVSIISQYLGLKNEENAKKYSALLLSMSVVIGIAINFLLFFFSGPILSLMGAEDEVLTAGRVYLQTRAFEMVPLFIFTTFQASRQAKGDTVTPVILSMISVVINVVLTGLFTMKCGLGIFGAAFATFLGQLAIAPICLIIMFSKKNSLCISHKDFSFELSDVKQIFRLAMPSAASQALSSLGFLIIQALVLDYGAVVSAAFSNGNKISNFLLIPVMALGSVMATFVGQNVGAGNKERAKKVYRVSRNISLIISIGGIFIIFPFREFLLGLLTNSSETLEVAVEYVFWILITQPLMAIFQNYVSLFNGSGNTKYSFYVSCIRLWLIRLPLIFIFKEFTNVGRAGIWYAMDISNLIIALFSWYFSTKIDFEVKVKH